MSIFGYLLVFQAWEFPVNKTVSLQQDVIVRDDSPLHIMFTSNEVHYYGTLAEIKGLQVTGFVLQIQIRSAHNC